MPPERDWRAPPDEAGDEALQYSDIAIGYLSRNARYRADYTRALGHVKRGATTADEATAALVNRWGISYHAAPGAAFDRKLAVARPDLSPASIIIAPVLAGLGASPLDMEALGDIRAQIRMGDFLHVILADPDGDEHLCVCGSCRRPMAVMLPIELDPLARLASAERLCRRLSGMAAGPPALRPPPFRREHLLTLLQVLDGRRAGASQRELAASLIHPKVRRYTPTKWTDSAERKCIRRWLKEAIELRDGGYIRLLRGG
ncbi:DUF2285 domain-containing protein [Altererythrobacter sp. H2]|uniref:DUF2285 domain-containing protein n=1 Tax=Erythrobacteraceae TaxID=335929 RepID=UPI001E53BC75|nr:MULTISPECIES: DUF2285 domain-containing protein [Erythrobacteraceae]WRK95790.1 DUF2285 domain-containing protein [Altererythrobacter sp. H2]